MMNVYEKSDFITEVPLNPWKEKISHGWKLRTEPEIKTLFEEYTTELEAWQKMFVSRENDFLYQRGKIGESIAVAFKQAGLLDQNNSIVLDKRHTINPNEWANAFRFVLFDPANTNASKLYQRMVEFSKITNNGHEEWLERFNARTDLFRYLATILPTIREEFDTKL